MDANAVPAWLRAGAAAAVVLLAAAPCLAQVTATVRPAETEAARFGTVSVSVVVNLGTSGHLLGGYGATLRWDPSKLGYLGDAGGGEPAFDAAIVNRTETSSGWLAFADAFVTGMGGRIKIFDVTFSVIADPYTTAAIDLEFTSMYAASTYEDLSPVLTVQDGLVPITDYDLDLRVIDPNETLFSWNAIPGAESYDLIRGDLWAVHDDGGIVQLGGVVCVEDDSADATTAAGAEAANPDAAIPPLGAAYFYLVRFHDGVSNMSYGSSYRAGHPRAAGAGDCP